MDSRSKLYLAYAWGVTTNFLFVNIKQLTTNQMNMIHTKGIKTNYKPFQAHNPSKFNQVALVVGLWGLGVVLVHLILKSNGL